MTPAGMGANRIKLASCSSEAIHHQLLIAPPYSFKASFRTLLMVSRASFSKSSSSSSSSSLCEAFFGTLDQSRLLEKKGRRARVTRRTKHDRDVGIRSCKLDHRRFGTHQRSGRRLPAFRKKALLDVVRERTDLELAVKGDLLDELLVGDVLHAGGKREIGDGKGRLVLLNWLGLLLVHFLIIFVFLIILIHLVVFFLVISTLVQSRGLGPFLNGFGRNGSGKGEINRPFLLEEIEFSRRLNMPDCVPFQKVELNHGDLTQRRESGLLVEQRERPRSQRCHRSRRHSESKRFHAFGRRH